MLHSIAPRYRRGHDARVRTRARAIRWPRLVERDWEVNQLDGLLADARTGIGAAAFIDAPAGMGKSRLLSRAGDMARQAGMRVLEAAGKELEREFTFGLARQLFEPVWLESGARERAALTAGPAWLARWLLNDPNAEPVHESSQDALIHALFHFTTNLVAPADDADEEAPLVLLADDVHHGDSASLRMLAYLGARLSQLPIAVVMAARSGHAPPDPGALSALRHTARRRLLQPALLTPNGVREVVRRRFRDAPGELYATCAHLTGGNPWLLAELLAAWEQEELPAVVATAEKLEQTVPARIRSVVAAQLESLGGSVAAVARAVAILDAGASVRRVAIIAELDPDEVLRSAAAMAAMDLLRPGTPLSFARPLIRASVIASLSPFERARLHRRAATILIEDGAAADQVAEHLLESPPGEDPGAAAILCTAAESAAASGALARATQLLERALAERMPDEVRGELLADLAQLEAKCGSPHACARLSEAARLTARPERRAELWLAHGRALYEHQRYREAAAAFEAGLQDPGSPDGRLTSEIEAAYVLAALLAGPLDRRTLDRRTLERRDAMLLKVDRFEPSLLQRAAIAHTVVHDALRGQARAAVRALGDRAWGDGRLLEIAPSDMLGWPLLAAALVLVDELERAVEVCDLALDRATRERPGIDPVLRHVRGWARYGQGLVTTARDAAHAALVSIASEPRIDGRAALALLAACHLEAGRLEQADAAIARLEHSATPEPIGYPLMLEVRARLRLMQHRPAEALGYASEAGRALDVRGVSAAPGAVPWRSTMALAHLRLDQAELARALAEEELQQAQRTGVTRLVIRNLRVIGLATGGPAGLDLLADAVAAGDGDAARLEHIRALVDLGAALRRANRRVDARKPLRQGLELAHKGGADVLAARAHTELVATGARPRRAVLSGVDALTASERRVADLAARGLTTRQIAQALFVTPKTIEFHLHHVYQKLDVGSRRDLASALADERAA